MLIYTVRPGDTLYSIAARYGIPPSRIALDNTLPDDRLSIGQALIIAYHSKVHTVRRGESLYSIAAKYAITVGELWRNNPSLNGGTELYPGQILVISYAEQKHARLAVTGYVYTFVEETVLRRTLPYLTYLAIFSYGIREDGTLVVPDDRRLITLAKQYGTKPMLVLTSLGDDGSFSTERVSRVLNNPDAVDRLIGELSQLMRRKGYDAVNCDFEFIPPEDRDRYTEFIAGLTREMHSIGKIVDVSLAPKTSGDQPGLLYEALDYPALGEVADTLLLMTYEWGYTYSEPRAVAPINLVAQVVNYAIGVIPRSKLLLGIPNYGYDWRLPWVEGEPAQSVQNEEAVRLANDFGAEIFFDERAMSPWFRYYDREGENHEVWFEDARSIDAKLSLAANRGLRGIGVWNATRRFGQLWFLLNLLYEIDRDE